MAAQLSASRAANIMCRTAHIGVAGILLGGHVFGVAAGTLLPFLYLTILTGAALEAAELYPNWRNLFEVRSIVIASKLLLLCIVPLLWSFRVVILSLVLVIASVGAHMPRWFRHYSFLEHQPTTAVRDDRTVI